MPPDVYNEIPSCRDCKKVLPKNLREIKCSKCLSFFHIKCCNLKSYKEFISINSIDTWCCHHCIPKVKKKYSKCGTCKKSIFKPNSQVSCMSCSKFFHKKCSSKLSPSWTCTECVDKILPFAALNDNEMILELKGKNINNVDLLDLPSYRMKSLLEKIPGKITINTQEFFLIPPSQNTIAQLNSLPQKSQKHVSAFFILILHPSSFILMISNQFSLFLILTLMS